MVFTALHKISIIIPVLSVGCVIEDPCPSHMPQTRVVDICQSSFATEIKDEGKNYVSVSIRVDKQTDNCTCHATIVNTKAKFTLYIRPYGSLNRSAPNFPNCGLEVDVYTSLGAFYTLSCTSGLDTEITRLDNENPIYFTTRANFDGNFTKGYCIELIKVHQLNINGIFQVSCGSYQFEGIPTADSVISTVDSNSIGIETDSNRESYTRIAVVIGSAVGGIIFTLAIFLIAFVCKRYLSRFKDETSQSNYQSTVSTVTMNQYNTLHVGSDFPTYTDITNYATIEDYANTVEN